MSLELFDESVLTPRPAAACDLCDARLPLPENFTCRFSGCAQPCQPSKPALSLVIDDLHSKLEFNILIQALKDFEAATEIHGKSDGWDIDGSNDPERIELNAEQAEDLRNELYEWFTSADEAPYSFRYVCAAQKIQPKSILKIVWAFKSGKIKKLPKLQGQRLTAVDVIAIRYRCNELKQRPKDLGAEFKVHPGHISRIRGYKQWKHLGIVTAA